MKKIRILKTGVGFLIDASAKTYETTEKQIREFVSNAVDAGAKCVNIEYVPSDDRLVIVDNGCGMDEKEFEENYLVIGCSKKYGDPSTIGRIGVGKFSAIPLCNYLEVRTSRGFDNKVFSATLNLLQLKDPNNRTKDITKMDLGNGGYANKSLDDPDKKFSPDGHFTKMTLRGLPDIVKTTFEDSSAFNNLCRNLGRILPLEYNPLSAAIKKLNILDTELADEMIKEAKDRSVKVIIQSPEHPSGFQLFRSLFGDDYEQAGEEICGDLYIVKSPNNLLPIRISGYMADMTTAKSTYAPWTGLNIRIQNTTVKENEFFGFTDRPAAARITGEIMISGVNEEQLITMDRSGFVTIHPQYVEIHAWLTEKLQDFSRRYVRKRTDFNSKMKKKSGQLENQAIVAESLERSIREVFSDAHVDIGELSKGVFKAEIEIDQKEDLLREFPEEIEEIISMPDSAADEIIVHPVSGGKFSLEIPERFLEYAIELDGITYSLRYVEYDSEEPVIDVDKNERIIRVNRNAPAINNGKHAMVLALVLLEYAFLAYSQDIEKLKRKIFEAIEEAFR